MDEQPRIYLMEHLANEQGISIIRRTYLDNQQVQYWGICHVQIGVNGGSMVAQVPFRIDAQTAQDAFDRFQQQAQAFAPQARQMALEQMQANSRRLIVPR